MMATTTETHRIRWYGVIQGAANAAGSAAVDPASIVRGRDLLVPRTRGMKGRDWGWDVVCSCGWESRAGGGTEASVRREVASHKWDVEWTENALAGEYGPATQALAERLEDAS